MKQVRGFKINYHRGFLDTQKPKGRVRRGKWAEDQYLPQSTPIITRDMSVKDDYVGKFSDYI